MSKRSPWLTPALVLSLVFVFVLTGCCAPLAGARLSATRVARAVTRVPRATATEALEEPPTATLRPGATSVAKATTAPSAAAPAASATVAAVTIQSSEEEQLLESLYESVNPSVVNIMVTVASDTGGSPATPGVPQRGQGSGFVYDGKGYIVTNNHVVANATSVQVTFADDISLPATVVGTDPDSDLAVIKVDTTGLKLRALPLGDSDMVKVGQRVIAIGNPFGLQGSMTLGIISALGRLLPAGQSTASGRYNIPDVIQTDAAINPGNSGGPLLNLAGQVVGVNAAIESTTRANSGVGFAIPSNIVRRVVPVLIAKGSYQHPWLGISGITLSPAYDTALGLPVEQRGVLVAEVTAGGPADKASIRASKDTVKLDGVDMPAGGDIVVGIDSIDVRKFDDLISYLSRKTEVGQKVRLKLLRDGKTVEVELTLGARPKSGNS